MVTNRPPSKRVREGKDGILDIPLRNRDHDIRQRAAVRLSRSIREASGLFARDTMFYFNFVRPVLENRLPGATGHQKHHQGKHDLPHNYLPDPLRHRMLQRTGADVVKIDAAAPLVPHAESPKTISTRCRNAVSLSLGARSRKSVAPFRVSGIRAECVSAERIPSAPRCTI
jgi:hypothetical protein